MPAEWSGHGCGIITDPPTDERGFPFGHEMAMKPKQTGQRRTDSGGALFSHGTAHAFVALLLANSQGKPA
jgi:hypothetical protein